ncbi:uncharacterized protein (TIGR02611 family) [Streptomyces sp. Amel2xB2]|nr:uncharacterized protein (TIGR02611 family) [Streptomyces sp. Amel2xB2]
MACGVFVAYGYSGDGVEFGYVGHMCAERDYRPVGSRAPRFIKASRPLHLSWQVVIFLLGLAVVAGGVVLLPLPGPGWLVIFAGIGLWATEFSWAQRVLHWTKRKVLEWTHWVKARREERRRRKQAQRVR